MMLAAKWKASTSRRKARRSRPQHLDRDHLPGLAQRRAVHLRERGGGDRRLEAREDRLERLTELGLDRGARLSIGKGGSLSCSTLSSAASSRADVGSGSRAAGRT